ncbi:MAG: sensor histidine kinase [Elusimicrobiota bacterium]
MTTAAAFFAGALLGALAVALAARRVVAERTQRYGRLFSFAMHELNTPVTAVNMTVINLLSGVFGDVPADQLKWLELTRDQVGRMNGLVGEIRDLVHMELHRELHLNVGEASPKEIADEALTSLRRGFVYANVELLVDIPPALPLVRTDPDRAARSLASALFHARKFRVSGPVRLRAEVRGGAVAFEIEYQGKPFTAAQTAASLEVFYPARVRKDQQLAATGLGLGLVRAVMRRVGGDLDFVVDPKGLSRLILTTPVDGDS